MARQTYVFWNGDHLREFNLSRRQYRRIAKSPCYITTREQWQADSAAYGTYLVTRPNVVADGPAITWQVTKDAAQWAALTQANCQIC